MTWTLHSVAILAIASVAGGVLVAIWSVRRDRRQAAWVAAMAARRPCPRCGTETLVSCGRWIATSEPAGCEPGEGPCLHCTACGDVLHFADEGDRLRPVSVDGPTGGWQSLRP